MARKAVQQFMLGSVLKKEASVRETLAAIKGAGYDSIELCGFMLHPMGFLIRMLTKAAGIPVGSGGNLDWEKLVKESGLNVVSVHQDLGFTEGGADAKLWMRRLGNRMKLWHVNDRGTRVTGPAMTPILKTDSMELGTGNMDLLGLWEIARENGVEAVILESHRNWVENSPVKSLELSAKWLHAHMEGE